MLKEGKREYLTLPESEQHCDLIKTPFVPSNISGIQQRLTQKSWYIVHQLFEIVNLVRIQSWYSTKEQILATILQLHL